MNRLAAILSAVISCAALAQSPAPSALDAPSAEKRIEALASLRAAGTKAKARAADIAALLGDSNVMVRTAAVEALLSVRPDLEAARERLGAVTGPVQTDIGLTEEWGFESDTADPRAVAVGLRDPDPEIRARTVIELAQLGHHAEPVLDQLLAMVTDPDEHVRASLAMGLPKIAWNPSVRAAVGELIKDRASRVRAFAARGLGRDDPDAVTILRGAMQDPDLEVRRRAVESLGKCGKAGQTAEPDLVATLRDRDPAVRRAALDSIGRLRLHSARALSEIQRHLADPEGEDCAPALVCLQRIGKDAAPAFDRVLELSRVDPTAQNPQALSTLWSIASDLDRGAAALRYVEAMCDAEPAILEHAYGTLMSWIHPIEEG